MRLTCGDIVLILAYRRDGRPWGDMARATGHTWQSCWTAYRRIVEEAGSEDVLDILDYLAAPRMHRPTPFAVRRVRKNQAPEKSFADRAR